MNHGKLKNTQYPATRNRRFEVAPSPFNTVKLELGILLFVGLLVALFLLESGLYTITCLLILGGYSVAILAWLLWRVQRILQRPSRSMQHSEEIGNAGSAYGDD